MSDAGRFEGGHDERRLVIGRQHEHRDPLEWHRLVAGEPGEVGAERQEQHVHASPAHGIPGAGEPLTAGQHRMESWRRHCDPANASPLAALTASRAW